MDFESILSEVGDFGKFQKSLLLKFMVPTTFASAFYVLNVIFMVATPDHWCFIPELSSHNLSESDIRDFAIPKLQDGSFSKCTMYAYNYSAVAATYKTTGKIPEFKHVGKIIPKKPVRKCTNGWVYQKEWYEETVVSQWDLVCDKNFLPSLVLTLANVGSVFGTFVFSTMADSCCRLGRPVYFLTYLCSLAILRTLTGSTVSANFQLPYIITVEQVGSKQRAVLVCISWLLWTLGACCLALVAYVSRNWTTLGLLTTLPIAGFLAYQSYLKQSPRFLMTKGRCEEAANIIENIAKTNGCPVPLELLPKLKDCHCCSILLFDAECHLSRILAKTISSISSSCLLWNFRLFPWRWSPWKKWVVDGRIPDLCY